MYRCNVYLAGKVGDVASCDETYAAVARKFHEWQVKLEKDEHIVVNPMNYIDRKEPWHLAMRTALRLLCRCDIIALMPDWEDSPGAKLEKEIAEKLKLEIVYL